MRKKIHNLNTVNKTTPHNSLSGKRKELKTIFQSVNQQKYIMHVIM